MSPSSSRTARRLRAAEEVLVALLAFGPLALGSAPTWVLGPCCGLAFLALGLALADARREGQRLQRPLFACVLALGVVTCAVQLVPLPPGLLALLSPRGAEVVSLALEPLGLPVVRPVSLDPPATWRELSKGLAALAVFVTAAHLASSRTVRRWLLMALALSGAAVALVGVFHWAAGLDALLGVFRFREAVPGFLTPFGNPNHLAGYLGLTGTVALGLALCARERWRQVMWGSAAVVCAVGVLSSLSRGGILCWVFGQLLLAALLRRARRVQGGRAGESIPFHLRAGGAVVFLGALCVGGLYASERLVSELATLRGERGLEPGKLELWPMFARAAGEFLPLGMGRGAFEAAFPRFHTELWAQTFTHPENVVLQLVAEQGLLVGVALLVGAVVCFLRALRRPDLETTDLAALAGVAALCAQNLVDFSLELPAVAHAALVAFGVVSRDWVRGSDRHRAALSLRPGPALALTALLAGVALLALIPGRFTLASAEADLLQAIQQGRPAAEVRALALAHIDRHPSAHFLQAAAGHALSARADGDPRDALGFINRALLLFPGDGRSHAAAARALLRLHEREQAFLEYRLAYEARSSRALLEEALARARTVQELELLTPEDARLAEQVAGRLLAATRVEEAGAYLQRMQQRLEEADPGARARLAVAEAWAHLRRGDAGAAAAACERAGVLAPMGRDVQVARAQVLHALGRPDKAVAVLEALLAGSSADVDVLLALARVQLGRREPGLAREALSRAAPLVTRLTQRALVLDMEAQVFEREGSFHRALEVQRTAERIEPSAARAFVVARLLERLGRLEEALASVKAGMAMEAGGGSAHSREWRARLEAHVAQGTR